MILKREDENMGIIGEKTAYKTVQGEDVHVGDVVVATCLDGMIRVVEPMVKSSNGRGDIKAFVMGIEMGCNDISGTIMGGSIVEIATPYTELKAGDNLGDCGVVVSDEIVEPVEEDRDALDTERVATQLFFGIIDKAIEELKASDKDYHGLEFIKSVLTGGGN